MPGLGSVGSIIGGVSKVAGPVLGAAIGSIGSGSRQRASNAQAARALVTNNSNPAFTSTFDPKTGRFSLAPSARIEALLAQGSPTLRLPFDAGEFGKEASGLSGKVDEIIGDLTQIEERFKNQLGGLDPKIAQFSTIRNATSEQLNRLRLDVRPGFGRLSTETKALFAQARQRLENQRQASVGDLSETLARRRIRGSSFAADAVSRREAEFGQLRAEQDQAERFELAGQFLQELDLSRQLIQQDFANNLSALQSEISNQLQRISTEFEGRFARVQTELGARFNESEFRLGALQAANQVATTEFGGELAARDQAFGELTQLGQFAVDLQRSIQSTFSQSLATQQELLAEAAKARGAAFGDLAEGVLSGVGDIFSDDKFGSLDVVGGTGTDTFRIPTGFGLGDLGGFT